MGGLNNISGMRVHLERQRPQIRANNKSGGIRSVPRLRINSALISIYLFINNRQINIFGSVNYKVQRVGDLVVWDPGWHHGNREAIRLDHF
jgi:hypothetical protein